MPVICSPFIGINNIWQQIILTHAQALKYFDMTENNWMFFALINMFDNKKSEGSEEFKRAAQKNLKGKEIKSKLQMMRGKEVFLTDTQTSDYTKSSNEMNAAKIQYLESTIKELQQENHQLKSSILDMKENGFYQINEEKLRDCIEENQKLREEVKAFQRQLEESFIERDFLSRFNKNLRKECEALTKELIQLKNSNKALAEKKLQKFSAPNSSSEDIQKFYRSASSELTLNRRKERRKKQHIVHSNGMEKLNSDYFIGRTVSKSKTGKNGLF